MREYSQLKAALYSTLKAQPKEYISVEQIIIINRPITWLKKQPCKEKFYWCSREHNIEISALGICQQINRVDSPDRIKKACYIGGMCFDENQTQWPEYSKSRFILPRIELRTTHDKGNFEQKLICHLNCRDNDVADEVNNCIKLLDDLVDTCEPLLERQNNRQLSTKHIPNEQEWDVLVNKALSSFNKDFQKVVLSRETTLSFADPIDHWTLLQHWQRVTPNCYQFAFQFSEHEAFIGCSPERLYLRQNQHIISEAVAGTVLRGNSEQADFALAESLFIDPKLRLENDLVQQFLEPILSSLCNDITVDKMTILKLKHIQHLKKSIHGELHHNVNDAMLINELHPTPAVGGYPKQHALEFIHKNEQYQRGWYSGLVGVLNDDKSELCVAIRSALITNNKMKIFSGAGIVNGSVADLEWQELNNKINTLLNLL